MDRLQTLTHKGKTIILVDLSKASPPEVLAALPPAQRLIAAQPPKSALILTDATDAVYNKQVSDAMRAFSSANTPYVRASAVVGATGARSILLQTVALVTGREIKTCSTRAEALDWLASR